MKLKDLLALGFLAVILVILGSFLVSKIGRGGMPRTAEVEIVQSINPEFNNDARLILLGQNEQKKATQYSAPANLGSGFGNSKPFGP